MQPLFIEKFLPDEILNLTYSYLIMKFGKQKEFKVDTQANSLIGEHAENLMEVLLDMSTPVIEQNLGKKLWPTYSYFRIYDKGSDLPVHTDRESCEFTVALCLGADPIDKPYEIFIGEKDQTSDYKYFDKEEKLTRLRIDGKYPMSQNNALIFKGMDKLHWREICEHDHYMMVFLHYVDQEGPYKEWKYDKRKSLLK
jgi:hypothetical protein